MVTAELAIGAFVIAVLVMGLAGLFGAILAQVRCSDAASEIARQAARGDEAAVHQIEEGLPDSAVVNVAESDGVVTAEVVVSLTPWGEWLPSITVGGEASVRTEAS
jgi:Flp pilus assembly protein TadG